MSSRHPEQEASTGCGGMVDLSTPPQMTPTVKINKVYNTRYSVKINKVYNTRYSQAVTHPSTNRALRCLTAVIGRELVFSTWYGRRQLDEEMTAI